MKKIIGGILMISLLSQCYVYVFANDRVIASKMFNAAQKAYYISLKSNNSRQSELTSEESVNDLIEKIDINLRKMFSLIKEKNNNLSKIKTAMDLKQQCRVAMTEQQVTGFQDFNSFYNEENKKLTFTLNKIDELKGFKEVQKEILKNQSDFDVMIHSLDEMVAYQTDAISSLDKIIDKSAGILQFL